MKNNKKILRFISCVLVLVICISIFVGCGTNILQSDTERYREVEVLTVGLVKVTMGDLIDWFNMNALSYLNQGYDIQTIWDALYPSFVEQRIFMNEALMAYNADSNFVKNTSALALKYKYGEYMSYSNGNDPFNANDAEFPTEAAYRNKLLTYFEKNIYHSILDALKSATEERLADKKYGYVINAAEEETTRDDMIINEDGTQIVKTSLWENDYDISKLLKEVNKELAQYPQQDYSGTVKFVYSKDDPQLQEVLEELNDRLNTDEEDAKTEVKAEDYIAAQKYAVKEVTKNLKSSNNKSIEQYIVRAVEEQIVARLASEGNSKFYAAAEAKITWKSFSERLANLTEKFINTNAKDRASFESFITNLSADSFIYDVPAAYQNEYHYVLNLLIPFSDEQTATLSQLSADYGSTSGTYLEQRYRIAKEIEVKKYSSENPEGIEPAETDAFKTISDFVSIDVKSNNAVTAITVQNSIKNMDINGFRKLIYDYGTDPGSINPAYGYVTGKQPFDFADSGNERFVKEFADASRYLANNPSEKAVACVTTYGIHIMYYVGPVVQDISVPATEAEFNQNKLIYGQEAGNALYRFYLAYYNEIKDNIVTKEQDAVKEWYKNAENNRKVVVNEKELKNFLNLYGGTFTNDYKQ